MSSLLVLCPAQKKLFSIWSNNLGVPSSNSSVICGRARFSMSSTHYIDLHPDKIPKHVAIILDGQRRWAKHRGLPVQHGYKFLAPNLKNVCNVSSKLGIQVLIVFAFSTENWIHFKKGIELTEEATKSNGGLHLMVALNYGGQYDMLQATKSTASKVKDGLLQVEDIDNILFEQELATKCAKFAKHNLLIRTGGELRISNFLLWQLAYSELYFSKKLFPDFGEEDLTEAILSFQQRHRRFDGRFDGQTY
ncbi:hypothetical protein HAX54_035189 [Datura stramonium]|uniref:Alkyl transferase n=1 Tax=Datura stramonium TaxID=4076 RepID=A0ABS8SF00_DATST|nr:hypothetical protein [Datura stramonium]